MGLHRGRWLVGNKRFFTCGSLETSEKSLDPCNKDSHRLSLLQGLPSAWPRKSKLQYLDVLHGRLLGSHVNFHWQLGGHNNHQPCSSNDISHCSSSQVSGSWHGFPGVDHEGRRDIAVLISVVTQRGVLVVEIAYGCPYYKDPAIFHLFLNYHKWKIVYSLLTICLCASP